jgi:hypothetical protein
VVDEADAELNMSLRAKQEQLAFGGDRTTLIWLAKQRLLGQKDRLIHSLESRED